MAITSIGYGGTVTEDDIPEWRRSFTASYGVVDADDWKVSLKAGLDRTVGIAAGVGFGHGVIDTNDAEVTVQLDTLASGTRYDLIRAPRNWAGAGGTTTFSYLTGTSSQTAVFATRDQTPGTLDDQPLALVQVNGNVGGGTIANIYDLRVWAANGGAVAADPLVLQYLDAPGTRVTIGAEEYTRAVDPVSSVAGWTKFRSIYSVQAGTSSVTWVAGSATATATVTFAAGRFSTSPLINAWPLTTAGGAAAWTYRAGATSATSATVSFFRTTTTTAGAMTFAWRAEQMTSTSATG